MATSVRTTSKRVLSESRSNDLYTQYNVRADSRFAPSQWETALLCNDVSHWLGAILELALLAWYHSMWSKLCKSVVLFRGSVISRNKCLVYLSFWGNCGWHISNHVIQYFNMVLLFLQRYGDVTISAKASQITNISTVFFSAVCSGVQQRKHQSSASVAFVRGIHRRPVDSPHKGW